MQNLATAYNAIFTTARDTLPTAQPWLTAIRATQLQEFLQIKADPENWQYHNLPTLSTQPHPIVTPTQISLATSFIDQYRLKNTPSYLLTFIDGFLCAALSDLQALPPNFVCCSINSALTTHETLLRQHYQQPINPYLQPFASLNFALFADGYFLNVPQDLKLTAPLHVLFIATDNLANKNCNLNNYILLNTNSKITLIEEYISLTTKEYFNNIFTKICLENAAELAHYKIQDESKNAIHLRNCEITQKSHSHITSNSSTLGGKLTRDALVVNLTAEHASYNARGIGLLNAAQTADYHTLINHVVPHCNSNVLFKNVLQSEAQGIFNGRVVVAQDAVKTETHLTNKNLLLAPTATMHTSPELEIYADDVKCTHGATVGQLDKNALFYLQSRGIATDTATQLLIQGFIQEILAAFPEALLTNRFANYVY